MGTFSPFGSDQCSADIMGSEFVVRPTATVIALNKQLIGEK